MKKRGFLSAPVAELIALMGHTDRLLVPPRSDPARGGQAHGARGPRRDSHRRLHAVCKRHAGHRRGLSMTRRPWSIVRRRTVRSLREGTQT
jgi:hypothetical protein